MSGGGPSPPGPNNKRLAGEAYRYAMSHGEIAEELGVTKQAVQETEKRALRKLRESGLLDDWEDWVSMLAGKTWMAGK